MGPIRSEQMCSRCRNHGISSILKGHKRACKYLFCSCLSCSETKLRQKCIASEIAIHRKHIKLNNINVTTERPATKFLFEKHDMKYPLDSGEHRRSQMCARCKNHGVDQPLRGHKNECNFANCKCGICEITAERRKIMAKQIRDYRQTKLVDEVDVQMQEDSDNESLSDEEEVTPNSPLSAPSYTPVPNFLDKFYMAHTLYDNFLKKEPIKQVQLLYALVILARENCTDLERALNEALPYANEYTIHHQNFPPRNIFENFLPPSPSSSVENSAARHVRVRNIRELIENSTNTSHSN